MVYTLDAQDGNPPDPSALVTLDHTIFTGSFLTDRKMTGRIAYRDSIPDHLKPYMLDSVMGVTIHEPMENGDIVFSAEEVRSGQFNGLRTLPPHSPKGLPRLGHRVIRDYPYRRLDRRFSS
jgi:hypothetical protein